MCLLCLLKSCVWEHYTDVPHDAIISGYFSLLWTNDRNAMYTTTILRTHINIEVSQHNI